MYLAGVKVGFDTESGLPNPISVASSDACASPISDGFL